MKRALVYFVSGSLMLLSSGITAFAEVEYRAYNASEVISTRKYADENYVFSVGGESFTLIDTFDDTSSAYLLIANQGYNKRTVYADSFTSTAPGNLNDWLNNTFTGINTDIREHIDFAHRWELDPAPDAAVAIEPGTGFTAGITIPSVSELAEYGDKLGYADTGDHFPTRTVLNGTDSKNILVYQHGTSGIDDMSWQLYNRNKPNISIRPMFFVDSDFFACVAVDLATAGDAVKDEIRKLGYERLTELYDTEEIIEQLGLTPQEGYVKLDDLIIKTVSGEDIKNGETLYVSFRYSEENEYPLSEMYCTWERVNGDEAEPVGDGERYIVSEADTADGKYSIRARITVTDEGGNSTSRITPLTDTVPAIVTRSFAPNNSISMTRDTDNTDYKFVYGGKSFTLIDSFNNDKSSFFVASNDSWGNARISSAYFDPEDETNIAYTLNTTLPASGINSNLLPEEIVDHIDFDHQWICETAPNNANVNVKDGYCFTAGITLLSFTEIERYKNIISTVDNLGGFSRTASNYLNSAAGKEEVNYINCIRWNDAGNAVWANHWETPSNNSVKPVFYIDRDFFLEERLDLSEIGAAALKILADAYTIEDLKGLYSSEELESKGFVHDYTVDVSMYGQNGGNAGISGRIISNIRQATDAVMIFAVYDDENSMVASRAVSVTLEGKNDEQALSMNVGMLPEGKYTAKLMLWDDLYNANAKIKQYDIN